MIGLKCVAGDEKALGILGSATVFSFGLIFFGTGQNAPPETMPTGATGAGLTGWKDEPPAGLNADGV
jgi:hypothetical protein